MLAATMLGIKLGKSVQESLAFETLKDVEGLLLPFSRECPTHQQLTVSSAEGSR